MYEFHQVYRVFAILMKFMDKFFFIGIYLFVVNEYTDILRSTISIHIQVQCTSIASEIWLLISILLIVSDVVYIDFQVSLQALLVESREQNKCLQFEVDDLKQKLQDARGDIKVQTFIDTVLFGFGFKKNWTGEYL